MSMRCDKGTEEGALLILPKGAHFEQFVNREMVLKYISENGLDLYACANDRVRGRQLQNGKLCIVTKSLKSVSWAIATFQNTSREYEIKMNLVTTNRSATSQSAGAQYAWDCQGTVEANVGPEHENDDLAGGENEPQVQVSSLRNQCLFVCTHRIRLAEDVWKQVCPGQGVVVSDQNERPSGQQNGIFQSASGSRLEQSTSLPSSLSSSTSSLSSPQSSLLQHSESEQSWLKNLGSVHSPPTSVSQSDSDSVSDLSFDSNDDDTEDLHVSHGVNVC